MHPGWLQEEVRGLTHPCVSFIFRAWEESWPGMFHFWISVGWLVQGRQAPGDHTDSRGLCTLPEAKLSHGWNQRRSPWSWRQYVASLGWGRCWRNSKVSIQGLRSTVLPFTKRVEEVKGSYSGPELGKEKFPISLHVACKSLTMCGKDKLKLECARAQTQLLATPFPLGSPGCLFLPEACRICRENLDAWASLSMQPLSGNNQSPKS